jgi:hypothetical protein
MTQHDASRFRSSGTRPEQNLRETLPYLWSSQCVAGTEERDVARRRHRVADELRCKVFKPRMLLPHRARRFVWQSVASPPSARSAAAGGISPPTVFRQRQHPSFAFALLADAVLRGAATSLSGFGDL